MRSSIIVALLALGCSSASPGTEASPRSAPPETQAELPRTREHANPPDAQLGTLPDGVGIAVGQPAPVVTVRDLEGEELLLSSLWRDRRVLLFFYRGGWCPYCNFQIHQLAEAFSHFDERGVGLAAISVDRVQEATRTSALWEIPFPVLSDQDLAAHDAFRVRNEVDAETLERLRSMGMDLEESAGREHHVIAVPAIFLIDQEGVVRWAHADLDYRTRPSPAQVLGALPE